MRKMRIRRVLLVIIAIICLMAGTFAFEEYRYKTIVSNVKAAKDVEIADLQAILNNQQDMFVFNKPLTTGHVIGEEDLMTVGINSAIAPRVDPVDKNALIGKTLKIDVPQYMTALQSLLYSADEIADDLRVKEYSIFVLPSRLKQGDSVDIRIKFPSGQDYIVLSKKQINDVKVFTDVNNQIVKQTIWIFLDEKEIIRMGSAVVDAYLNKAELYAIQYVEPFAQDAAKVTYPVNNAVLDMIKANPKLIEEATIALQTRKSLEDSLLKISESDKQAFQTSQTEVSVPGAANTDAINTDQNAPQSTEQPTDAVQPTTTEGTTQDATTDAFN